MTVENKHVNIDMVAAETLVHLSDALVMKNLCSLDLTADYNVKPNGYKVGQEMQYAMDPDFEVKTFDSRTGTDPWPYDRTKTIDPQSIRTSTRTLRLEKHRDISIELSSREITMSYNNPVMFSQTVLKKTAQRIAEDIDIYIASKINEAQGLYVSATLFETQADMALANKEAVERQLGNDNFALVNPSLQATILGKDWVTNSMYRGDSGSRINAGQIGKTMGFDFYSSVNFPTITRTNSSGAATTKTSPTDTENIIGIKTLTVDAIAAGSEFLAGDRIKIAGHPRTFIVASNVAEGATTIPLVDEITELIPKSAAVTVIGGDGVEFIVKGAIFNDKAIGFAMPILSVSPSAVSSSLSLDGISVRATQAYDITRKVDILSIDYIMGAFAYDPRKIILLADTV